MSVVVSVEDVGPSRKEIKVEVPAPAVEAELARVVQEFRKRARIAGFRKGKVPLELVRQRYQEEIREELVDRLMPRYWRQAQAEAEVDPMLPPEVGAVDFEPGTPLTFTATVDLRPKVELGELEGFEFPEFAVEPTDAEVEQALTGLRRDAGEWVTTERSAAVGDFITGTVTEVGEEEAAGEAGKVGFEVGDANIWEELSLAVTGLAAGGESEFTRQEGESERRLVVKVEEVKERELPPLDDAFAAKVGKFTALDELREAVRHQIRHGKEDERRRRRETALLDQLCQRHPLEISERVVGHETEEMMRDYAHQLAHRGVDPERAGVDWRKMSEEFAPQARRRVQSRLLLDAAAAKLGVELPESEFEAQLAALARAQGQTVAALRRTLDKGEQLDGLKRRMLRSKTLLRLIGENGEAAGDSATESSEEEGED
jgi:trigger factor